MAKPTNTPNLSARQPTPVMIENVADVLMNCGCGTSDECERIARLAIEAMRSATLGMCLIGAETLPDYDPGTSDALHCWQAMIDAALGTKAEGR